MKGLSIRRHHEKRIKEKVCRRFLGYLLVTEDSKGVRTLHSPLTLVDKERQGLIGVASNRHGVCNCGRDHGMCGHSDKEIARLLKRKEWSVREEIKLAYQG